MKNIKKCRFLVSVDISLKCVSFLYPLGGHSSSSGVRQSDQKTLCMHILCNCLKWIPRTGSILGPYVYDKPSSEELKGHKTRAIQRMPKIGMRLPYPAKGGRQFNGNVLNTITLSLIHIKPKIL